MKIDSVDPKSGLGSSTSRSLDDELLEEAMNHIPKDAAEKAKKASKVFKRERESPCRRKLSQRRSLL